MREQRLVVAGNLPAWKARILLRLLLATTSDIEALQHHFDRC
jgi:L-asparaginase/Glu-tRNA(Gln) amidotransferase subunit D